MPTDPIDQVIIGTDHSDGGIKAKGDCPIGATCWLEAAVGHGPVFAAEPKRRGMWTDLNARPSFSLALALDPPPPRL